MSTDYTEFESKMKKTASVLTEQYDSVRAGKANPPCSTASRSITTAHPTPDPADRVDQHAGRPLAAHPAVGRFRAQRY